MQNQQRNVSLEEKDKILLATRKLSAIYPVHIPSNFEEILRAKLALDPLPSYPVFFTEKESHDCVTAPVLLRQNLSEVAELFPDPTATLGFLVAQYEEREMPEQKARFLIRLIEGVRIRSNILVHGGKTTQRSEMTELSIICRTPDPPIAKTKKRRATPNSR